jgi:hypothetical protein
MRRQSLTVCREIGKRVPKYVFRLQMERTLIAVQIDAAHQDLDGL